MLESLENKGHHCIESETVEEGHDELQAHSIDVLIWFSSGEQDAEHPEPNEELLAVNGVTVLRIDPPQKSSGGHQEGHSDNRFSRPVNLDRLHRVVEASGTNKASVSPGEEENKGLDPESGIVTLNPEMETLLEKVQKVGPLDCNVLLVGETGTGKEQVARAIHRTGSDPDDPFVGVNCPGLSENLLESELFGFKKGSFTGANEDRKGFFEDASEGTLLLDEIGSMSKGLQAKLLRVLEEETFYRVGSVDPIQETPRIISAVNELPEGMIEQGDLRRDLYFRLNVVELHLPPLRNRPEDLLPLAHHFISECNESFDRKITGLSEGTRAIFRDHHWPGNVRELKNTIEGAVIFNEEGRIETDHLPPTLQKTNVSDPDPDKSFSEMVASYKKQLITATLERTDGSCRKAARRLGVDRSTIYRYRPETESE